MKKRVLQKLCTAGLFMLITANLIFAFTPITANAMDPIVCKVEVVDCPGLGTGDRQICHQNGTGVTCTCGHSTLCEE